MIKEELLKLADDIGGVTTYSKPPLRDVTGRAFGYDALERFASAIEANALERAAVRVEPFAAAAAVAIRNLKP